MSPDSVPATGRIGVLLVNLGTPDSTGYFAMRRYLKEFLSDRRVIEENRLKWWLVLNLIILTVRPGRKGRDYDKIWNKERNESPLKTITRSQSDKLEEIMDKLDRHVRVDWAMRYGNPSIRSRLEALAAQDCGRILIVPLYPQYAGATTATVCDEVFRSLSTMRFQPTLRVAAPYYAEPVYIDALASSLNAAVAKLNFKPDIIVASFHGMNSRATPIALPTGPLTPASPDGKPAARPVAGPVVPLTVAPGNTDDLLGGAGNSSPHARRGR